ncbi:cysteine desulfurase family protein [Paludifilum halophilum]|uniref:cysteine desulfurase n=1 Tax=Paludifilum halophilum TaxID=1642702 RepID=A0A235B2L4_9BACL|nr:cysteine desulfurase family protein [Paludifilum halophilum]OYD06199.1 cysteine desulfurase NifS [Paludifilum halophilum]
MKPLYFDHGATTPLRREVHQAMIQCMEETFANPGSLHDEGTQAADQVEHARKQMASAIGASSREILFTGSGTEANNLAILGAARKARRRGRHIITTQVEHPSVLKPCHQLEEEGFRVTYLPVDEMGMISLQDLDEALTPETILVSVMAANNEVGTLMPIHEIADRLRKRRILFHTDAVQYFGKHPFDVSRLGVDLLTLSGHKINGPKGIGALYLRKGIRLDPLLFGGGQERGLRPGTQNVPGIAGLGVAARLAAEEATDTERHLIELRNLLWNRISREIPGVRLNGHPEHRLSSNLNLSFDRVEGQAILLELNRSGISVSSGSACSAGKHAPSHVLTAMGRHPEEAYQSLRITLGKENGEEDIHTLVERLKEVLGYLRSLIRG